MSKPRRNALRMMGELVRLIRPLKKAMTGAITMGVIGFLLAFGIGVFGAYALVSLLFGPGALAGIPFGSLGYKGALVVLVICALTRGIFNYLEQYLNHYIAFTVLAELRNKIFAAMQKLAPAKMEGKDKGNLVSMVKGDIELLEVFYAHTISPIVIAFITWLLLGVFYWQVHPLLMLWALLGYLVLGVVLPMFASAKVSDTGMQVRNEIGGLNGLFLDKLRGVRELMQFGREAGAIRDVRETTETVVGKQLEIRTQEAKLTAWADTISVVITVGSALIGGFLVYLGLISPQAAFIAVILQSTTYAPFINLANLGNMLTHTFAAGERVLSLLAEEPEIEFVEDGQDVAFGPLDVDDVSFSYMDSQQTEVLDGANLKLLPGEFLGIMGPSGCGKSTLLKLIMRFWDSQSGEIRLNETALPTINTEDLWSKMSYMTQSPIFFSGDLRSNIQVAKADATDEEIWSVLEDAAIADMIRDLPEGLDTDVSELGENFSGGERQRIALARCFLADTPLILLDEPTSNLDAQNEALILRSLYENKRDKTVILVSHRKSSLGICDRVIRMEEGRCYVS